MIIRRTKILYAGFCCLIGFAACRQGGQASPYQDILENQPFSALSDSIHKDPQNHVLLFRRAVLLNSNNFPEPALDDFRNAWQLKKDEQYALGIGTLLLEKKADSAIQFLQHALQELPHSFLLTLNLARAYTEKENWQQALDLCDTMLQWYPQSVDVLKLKAILLDKTANVHAATQLLEQAYQLTPYDTELNYILALRYAESKNPKVLALCDSLIRADSAGLHGEPYYFKGIYFANTNEKQKALASFDAAVKHDYYLLEGYIEKGSLYFEMKKYTEALEVFRLALSISPDFADAYYWAARCQEETGDRENAALNYRRAWELDKSFTEAEAAMKRLGK